MKLLDLNLLLYAINADAPHHEPARAWLERTLNSGEPVGLPWAVLLGFLRIATRPGIFPRPLTPEQALAVVDGWLALPTVQLLNPGDRHWTILRGLLQEAGTAGNLTTDAHLAALALEFKARLCSSDHDFARFRGLQLENPISDSSPADDRGGSRVPP